MVKLTSNEGKVRKILMKYPHGIKARFLIKEGCITKTPLYNALNQLEVKGLAFRGEHNLWYPENPLRTDIDLPFSATNSGNNNEKSLNQHDRMGLFDWLTHRSERKEKERQHRIKVIEYRVAFGRARHELYNKKEGKVTRDEILALEKKYKEHFGID